MLRRNVAAREKQEEEEEEEECQSNTSQSWLTSTVGIASKHICMIRVVRFLA